MATRKPWASLSASYRERLARKGITEHSHSSGGSLREGRGHEHTPEHPSEAISKPDKFPIYMRKRTRLVAQVIAKKHRLWGIEHKFNDRRARKMVNGGFDGKKPPSLEKLRWAIQADESEMLEAMSSGDEDYSFLWYH
jgi:hypothetical protein